MILFLLTCISASPDEVRALPGVVDVAVSGANDLPHRVIHILDWHYVPEKSFQLDSPEGDYQAFLDAVEALQDEQRAFIRALGVKTVFLEGLTDKSRQHFEDRVQVLRKFKRPKGDDPVARFVAELRREDELQLGAPGKMLIANELTSVLPADDFDLHAAANPLKNGRLVFDAASKRGQFLQKLVNEKAAAPDGKLRVRVQISRAKYREIRA